MNESDDAIKQSERRRDERRPMDGTVTVHFDEQEIVGPGQNISEQGIFFVAEAAVKVRVQIDGSEEWRDGEVVRVQSMGEGKLGVAVRFV